MMRCWRGSVELSVLDWATFRVPACRRSQSIIGLNFPFMTRRRSVFQLGLFDLLPPKVIDSRPELSVHDQATFSVPAWPARPFASEGNR